MEVEGDEGGTIEGRASGWHARPEEEVLAERDEDGGSSVGWRGFCCGFQVKAFDGARDTAGL